jgi:DNA-binding transcriptional ArsR family regulator
MSLEESHDQLAELRSLAHPLRLRMLSLLTGAAMSAAEVARELDITHANASYHLRQLYAAGQIVVAEEVGIRGGKARRYRYDVDQSRERTHITAVDGGDRRAMYLAVADELRRRVGYAAGGPTRQAMADVEVWIDEAAWSHFIDRATELMDEVHRAAVPPRTPGAIHTNSTLLMFTMTDKD